MTIGRIMDYIEARLEAIKSREEEEDEDEEKERERERERERNCASGQVKAPSGTPSTSKPAAPPLRSREYVSTCDSTFRTLYPLFSVQVSSAPMTPLTPTSLVSTSTHARPASTPPSPPSLYRPLLPPQSLLRSSKSRLFAVSNANPKDSIVSPAAAPFSATLLPSTGDPSVAIINPPTELAFPSMTPPVAPEATGTKRRHAAMTAESTGPSNPIQSVSVPRRRIRSSRTGTLNTVRENYDQNQSQASSDAMEVEEDGRERKRVARR